MAELAETLAPPPERSIAEQQADAALDAKLKAASGQPVMSLIDTLQSRFGQLAVAIEQPPERAVRLVADEGDPPAVPDTFRRGMVPARFAAVTFDSYQPSTPSQYAALKAARFWTERALAGDGCMLALIGPQGTGKSHLLYAAANVLLDAGTRLYARPWYRLADELRYGGAHPITAREMDTADVRRSLWTQKIVLLDEVRATASTAFDDTELTKFACHFYDSRYPMFLTSNVNPLADVMGAPAASRFTQVVIDGKDWRQS
jgi:energy-coupling factor transporter ATP-binding protein EcfA2